MSPSMQNAAFQASGLDYLYVPFKVKKEDLEQAVQAIRALNIRGMNVTIPHKVAVMPLLDKLDPLAEKIGAVNTIVNDCGKLCGYNTDAAGFLNALMAERVDPSGKKIVILGAGGAARAIAGILAETGADLIILNRHQSAAIELAGRIYRFWNRKAEALESSKENLEYSLGKADILVNTTSLGMLPDGETSPVPADLIRPELIVFDIIYNPLYTRLLKESEKKGAKIFNGIEMLVGQGSESFKLWTGKTAPFELMKKVVLNGLLVK
jgi:shikimate dehydrogenase